MKASNKLMWYIVCSNQNRSMLVLYLLSYNSLLVGQLYADKSLK